MIVQNTALFIAVQDTALRTSEGLINSTAGQSELSVITPHHLPPALHFVGIRRLELLLPFGNSHLKAARLPISPYAY